MFHLKVGTKYTVQPIRMICGYNGKGCFSLSLTNMPPPPPYIGLAKQAYYQNSFKQYTSDSKKTWQTINELTSCKSGKTAVTSLKVNGVSITNPTELSNEFNNHFSTIGPELCLDSPDGDVYQRYITSTVQ